MVASGNSSLPQEWSQCEWVSTRYRTGLSVMCLTSRIRSRANEGTRSESITSTPSSPTMMPAFVSPSCSRAKTPVSSSISSVPGVVAIGMLLTEMGCAVPRLASLTVSEHTLHRLTPLCTQRRPALRPFKCCIACYDGYSTSLVRSTPQLRAGVCLPRHRCGWQERRMTDEYDQRAG